MSVKGKAGYDLYRLESINPEAARIARQRAILKEQRQRADVEKERNAAFLAQCIADGSLRGVSPEIDALLAEQHATNAAKAMRTTRRVKRVRELVKRATGGDARRSVLTDSIDYARALSACAMYGWRCIPAGRGRMIAYREAGRR